MRRPTLAFVLAAVLVTSGLTLHRPVETGSPSWIPVALDSQLAEATVGLNPDPQWDVIFGWVVGIAALTTLGAVPYFAYQSTKDYQEYPVVDGILLGAGVVTTLAGGIVLGATLSSSTPDEPAPTPLLAIGTAALLLGAATVVLGSVVVAKDCPPDETGAMPQPLQVGFGFAF